ALSPYLDVVREPSGRYQTERSPTSLLAHRQPYRGIVGRSEVVPRLHGIIANRYPRKPTRLSSRRPKRFDGATALSQFDRNQFPHLAVGRRPRLDLQARPLFFIAPTAAATGTARNTYVNVSLRAYRLRSPLLPLRGLRGREA